MVSFPYYSHTTPIRIPKDMGMVWEAYHKGVPLLGVPGITLDMVSQTNLFLLQGLHGKNIQKIISQNPGNVEQLKISKKATPQK